MLKNILVVARGAILAFGLVAFGMSAAASAQELDPEALNLARTYVAMTDRAKVYERTVVQTGLATLRTILATNPEINDQLTEVTGDVVKTYADRKSELVDQFARIYAARFTVEELQAIIDFYATPVGRKLLRQNRPINAQITQTLRVFESNLSKEFYAKVKAGLKAKGIEI